MLPAKKRLMPAEWEPHVATWIAWPRAEQDFPGKLAAVHWVYAEIVRLLAEAGETVRILVDDDKHQEFIEDCLTKNGVAGGWSIHRHAFDRTWLRDSAPTAVRTPAGIEWVTWKFTGWAKYDNHRLDQTTPQKISELSNLPLINAVRPDNGERLVLEGGAIDVDGEGTVLVTEECLLSPVQERNPGLNQTGYEAAFAEYLGAGKTIWLSAGCAGDDTHGHIDDIARFAAPARVLLAYEPDAGDENHAACEENLQRLQRSTDACGRKIEVIKLPLPKPIVFDGMRVPASYANFYIANRAVIVPTFNDPNDQIALGILAEQFPQRTVVGLNSRDLIWGLGAVHCLSQQQPA